MGNKITFTNCFFLILYPNFTLPVTVTPVDIKIKIVGNSFNSIDSEHASLFIKALLTITNLIN